ncbi:MAG: penicillin-binding transpeptidase domain-containing protein [Oscillospiraceae bacterium]|nr:penicillin-binding transpeptidase domain-containing protein [Oscillospiraceae bacterium]
MINIAPSKKMRARLNLIAALLFTLSFLILAGRVFYISVIAKDPKGNKYKLLAESQQLREVTLNAGRGTIYDRNMKILAQSASAQTIFISPNEIKNEETRTLIAKNLSEILNLDEQYILDRSKRNSYFEIVARKVEADKADQVVNFILENEINAVHLVEDSKRYYPESLAAAVIGFTDIDGKGVYGIEARYDKQLRGVPGKLVAAKNARGTDMNTKYEKYFDAQNGNGLILTLDYTIQHFLEEAVADVERTHKAKNRACGLVMDVNTGAVLAMTSKPDFDLNNPREISDQATRDWLDTLSDKPVKPDSPDGEDKPSERQQALRTAQDLQWKNKVITELYEPGSVFKTITGSAALEEGTSGLDSSFSCGGSTEVGGERMRCWRAAGHGTNNFTGAMVHSCNPAFISIGQNLGVSRFFQYFKQFGFTGKTGIDLPGEASSLYVNEKTMGIVELASCSFGQSNKITPIQMVTAFAATVNGGYLVTPHVVSKIIDNDGNVIENLTPDAKRQVISKETSEKMRTVLERVVDNNGGTNAFIKGYRIGGKSGTSQKLDSEDKNARVSSYCGFAPVDDPQIAVFIMVDEPSSDVVFGSVVSAPSVAAVMSDVLPYLGITKQYGQGSGAKNEVAVPNLKGGDPIESRNKLSALGLKSSLVGDGAHVVRQMPSSGTAVAVGSTVILYTSENAGRDETAEVPDVVGLSLAAANQRIVNAGFNLSTTGAASGGTNVVVISQEVNPGTTLPRGSIITVRCVDKSEIDGN